TTGAPRTVWRCSERPICSTGGGRASACKAVGRLRVREVASVVLASVPLAAVAVGSALLGSPPKRSASPPAVATPAVPEPVLGERAACYALRRIVNVPDPPYGERAEYCFAGDGVPLLTRIERREGTDERVAVAVSRRVGDGDVQALLAAG